MSLTKKTTGAINQMMCMDGTTAIKDAIYNTAFTMQGGVGNTWDDNSSNFRTILGAQAPVIAQATTNKLTYASNNSTFAATGVGGWTHTTNCSFAASTTQAWVGAYSGKMKITANGAASVYLVTTGLIDAGVPYTLSAKFKGVIGKSYYIFVSDDGTGGTNTESPIVVADGTWQTCSVTRTSPANSTIRRAFLAATSGAQANDIVYWDAIQLETGSIVTPYCVDSADDAVTRTACTMTIPTATIGLVPGQDLTIMCVVNTPWAGNDGIEHDLFSNRAAPSTNGVMIYKSDANVLTVGVRNAASALRTKSIAVNAANWPANTNHVIIVTITSANTQRIFLDGVEGTTASGASGRENALNANVWIGTALSAGNPTNGAILCAIWGRILGSTERLTAGWVWHVFPRAVYYNGKTYYGYIDNKTDANVWVGCYDHATATHLSPFCVKGNWHHDDHASPSIHIRGDGRIMVFYSRHGDTTLRLRISTNPEDISAWDAEAGISNETTITYPRVVETTDGRIFVYYRCLDGGYLVQRYRYSDDDGVTWTPIPALDGTEVLREDIPPFYEQYCRFVAYGNTIQVVGSPTAHEVENVCRNIYWARWDGTDWVDHDDNILALPLSSANMELAFDCGASNIKLWDMVLDSAGNPHIAFAYNIIDGGGVDTGNHEYHEVRWTGVAWSHTKICDSHHGGVGNPVYSGGLCLDQHNPDYAYCSVAVNGILEIQKFHYSAGTWAKVSDLTSGSVKDNIRPCSPVNSLSPLDCIWENGDYHSFINYDMTLRMLSEPEILAEDCGVAMFSDPSTWASAIDLPQITVTGLSASNAVRLCDSAGNIHASAVESGGTATLYYTLD